MLYYHMSKTQRVTVVLAECEDGEKENGSLELLRRPRQAPEKEESGSGREEK